MEDGSIGIIINDAASGSQIIAFSLSVLYSSDRPLGQNLIPTGINYCLADEETTTTQAPTTAVPTTAGDESISCLQARLDAFCQNLVKPACANFEFARFNTRWRCYDSIDSV